MNSFHWMDKSMRAKPPRENRRICVGFEVFGSRRCWRWKPLSPLLILICAAAITTYIIVMFHLPRARTRLPGVFTTTDVDIRSESREHPQKQPSLREERHYFRFEKTMLTDSNTTFVTYPYDEWPPLVDIRPLPTASIIISFHNQEQVSLLLHTVHSIIQRTPKRLVKEIILIDDKTYNDDLQQVLTNYIQVVFDPSVVRLYRSPTSLGLIHARNLGARMAQGDVIVCLDSHTEVQPQWLERLLYEVHLDNKTLATSYLDWFIYNATDNRWHYKVGARDWVTFFTWSFSVGFQESDSEQGRMHLADPCAPVRSPVMIGANFAIDRKFFFEIGGFDEKMLKWGGDNIDLPIRVWLYGGRVVNVPCSVAAHYEGSTDHPNHRDYRNDWGKYIYHNFKRVAEVLFGEYKEYIYNDAPEIKASEIGDISERELTARRAPRNISWYLNNIFPELVVPHRDSLSWGQVRNIGTGWCLTQIGEKTEMRPCSDIAHANQATQTFMWNKNGELRWGLYVFDIIREKDYSLHRLNYIPNKHEHTTARWVHWKDGPFMDSKSKLCLTTLHGNQNKLWLSTCKPYSKHQQWWFLYYTGHYDDLSEPLPEDAKLTKTQKRMREIMSLDMAKDTHEIYKFLRSRD